MAAITNAPVSRPTAPTGAKNNAPAPAPSAPAMSKDSLATSQPAKAQDDKGGHGWKIFGIAGIAIGGLSLAALGAAAVYAFKMFLNFGSAIG